MLTYNSIIKVVKVKNIDNKITFRHKLLLYQAVKVKDKRTCNLLEGT